MVKHCTRCNKSINSAWRTLDEKKFYHPHCFSCAVCNVTLECVQECGVPNLKEVYCKKCYRECLQGEKISRWYENSKRAGSGKGQGEQILQLRNVQSRPQPQALHVESENSYSAMAMASLPLPPPSSTFEPTSFAETQTTLDVTFTSKSQYHPPRIQQSLDFSDYFYQVNGNEGLQEQTPPQYQPSFPNEDRYAEHQSSEVFVIPNVLAHKLTPKKSSNKVASTTSSQNMVRPPLKRQKSRIPRPTSAYSAFMKNVLPVESTVKQSSRTSLKTKTKSLSNQLHSSMSKVNNDRSRSSKSAISRSASMVQPRPSRTSHISRINTKPQRSIKTSKSKSFSRPPKSAFAAELSKNSDQTPQPNTSKRQCAATFSNSVNCHEKVQSDPKAHHQNSSALHYEDHAYFQQMRKESSSCQAASSTLSRNSSSADKASVSRLQTDDNGNNIQAYSSNELHFDCPICLTSLFSGACEGNSKRNAKGNVVTICGHLFHRTCIENWLKSKGNKRCPICSSLCLLDTLQSVYLDCNVTSELPNSKQVSKQPTNFVQANKNVTANRNIDTAYLALKYEYEQLKRKYNAMVQEKTNYSLNVTIANNLQHAYDMECRNRLQLQWENKKLRQQIQELYRDINDYKNRNEMLEKINSK